MGLSSISSKFSDYWGRSNRWRVRLAREGRRQLRLPILLRPVGKVILLLQRHPHNCLEVSGRALHFHWL
jgi:hypothetical protein